MLSTKISNTNNAKSRFAGKKILAWLDQNILTLLTGILLVLIPALPKVPLADLIEGYIVRLRFEDFLVLFAMLVWLVQLFRGRLKLPTNTFAKLIYLYLGIGLLSSLSAVFLTQTVPLEQQHLFKLALHYVRRVEYFALFFLTYAGIRNKKDLSLILWTALFTLLGVVLYGYGQKYLLWPAFSTMNREFSKGTRLYLTPNSRVMSTFAGHYDYAAYLMMALSFIVATIWTSGKNWLIKLGMLVIAALAYWSLILTSSRTSFLGYLGGITAIAWVYGSLVGKWSSFGKWLGAITVSMIIMLTMGDLSERFFSIVKNPDLLVHDVTQILPIKREWISNPLSVFGPTLGAWGENLAGLKNRLNQSLATPPPQAISTDELAAVSVPSDTPPTTTPPLPPDVTAEEDAFRKQQEALQNAPTPKPDSGSGYSPNALKYGLSIAIRLDALWPRAWAGFIKNPLLGSGYSTLTKAYNEEFTQAESTDNDYLRMLGETGILGTLSFLAIPVLLLIFAVRLLRQSSLRSIQVLALGTIGAVIGLLINATYIDVFESSKIAYLFAMLIAIVVRAGDLYANQDHV